MNILNIDFDGLRPHMIDAFTHIYGEEYHSIISDRVNKTLILSYLDPDAISSYASFLKSCKQREYSIKFLERIGIDTQQYKKANYTDSLNEVAEELLKPYIYVPYFGMDNGRVNTWDPLRAFDLNNVVSNNDNEYIQKKLIINRIELINHLRGEDKEKLIEETFPIFTETEEYAKLLEKINELRAIHDELLTQYSEWEKCVIPYEEYVESERKREEDILQKKKEELFTETFSDIPNSVKMAMAGKSSQKQQDMFLYGSDLSSNFYLEKFSSENMIKLNSSNVSLNEKSWIALYQIMYLEAVGVDVPQMDLAELETEVGIKSYLEFLKQEKVRAYIPSEELISRITTLREKKYEEALKEYYTTRADFVRNMQIFDNDPNAVEPIYYNIKNKHVCLFGGGGYCNGEFISIMFYTPNSYGHLFASLLHEIGHVIDQTKNGCGFETSETINDNGEKNPYDKEFRKYEKFNETINDMFKMEAVEFFQSQGIYHIESQEFVQLDISNYNTAAVTKDLLKPLLQQFRKQVIRAKITCDQTELTKYIGIANFETLVDAVNKVDYLSRNELIAKINESPDDPMVIEYKKQVARVGQVYMNIDSYNRQRMSIPSINPSDSQIISGRKR